MAKGEIARFEQFLLLPQCFQKSSAAHAAKCIYKLERANKLKPIAQTIISHNNNDNKSTFENMVKLS